MTYHLYHFKKGHQTYQESMDHYPIPNDNLEDTKDSRVVPLDKIFHQQGAKMNYVYDFGDNWEHKIVLEKTSLPDQHFPHVPICIGGKETAPAEDTGGIHGYYYRLEDAKDVNHPEREHLLEMLENNIEERKYDLEAINQRLANFNSQGYHKGDEESD